MSQAADLASGAQATDVATDAQAAERLLKTARATRIHIACAESCTAGLVCATLASLGGASEVLLGGVVSYTPEIKEGVLGLPHELVDGAYIYSEACASAMARGVYALFGATLAVGITGVAGPEPSEGVGPGNVWISVYHAGQERSRHFFFEGTRNEVRAQACDAAIKLMLEVCMESNNELQKRQDS